MKSTELTSKKKLIVCPEIDKLIEECPVCHLGLPKALLPDTDDGEFRGGYGHARVGGRNNRQTAKDKEKKFGMHHLVTLLPTKVFLMIFSLVLVK